MPERRNASGMKQFIKHKVLPVIASRMDVRQLIKQTDQPLINVCYHTVSDSYLPHINPIYTPKTTAGLENDLEYLLKYFRPVSVDEVLEHVKGRQAIQSPSFHLSFDDGLRGVYTVAAPILQRHGIPATVFVNTAFVDNADLFFRYKAALIVEQLSRYGVEHKIAEKADAILRRTGLDKGTLPFRVLKVDYLKRAVLDEIAELLDMDFTKFLKEQKPYLDSAELNKLKEQGFSIGSHSIDHPYYSQLNEAEALQQTIDSCNFVQKHFQMQNRYFAFPFGDEGKRGLLAPLLREVDIAFGASGIKAEYDGCYLHRIDMEVPPMEVRKRINKAYLTHLLKKI